MKKKDIFLLITMLCLAIFLIAFSNDTRKGAYDGLVLAENTIIPSLLPLLILFLMIMKTGARNALARCLGWISVYLFRLPAITLPAIFLGLIGGYPTGVLLTNELFEKQEISKRQAHSMLSFNFCGGCGFIITALGSATLHSSRAGAILFVSNIISSVIIGTILRGRNERCGKELYSFCEDITLGNALVTATQESVSAVLNISAFIILFCALSSALCVPDYIKPLLEITSGTCSSVAYPLPVLSAYLAFGGICIHLQLLPYILKCGMKYRQFLLSRIIAALLSYMVTRLMLIILPTDLQVFSSTSERVAVFSSLNMALSALLIIGCFVIILDLSARKRPIDK